MTMWCILTQDIYCCCFWVYTVPARKSKLLLVLDQMSASRVRWPKYRSTETTTCGTHQRTSFENYLDVVKRCIK
ncbi:unnamed protein product [Ectocarpus sp. 12 AP-2014]